MPRAFLIKKKRAAVGVANTNLSTADAAEANNTNSSSDLQPALAARQSSLENKENLQTVAELPHHRGVVVSEESPMAMVARRNKEDRKAGRCRQQQQQQHHHQQQQQPPPELEEEEEEEEEEVKVEVGEDTEQEPAGYSSGEEESGCAPPQGSARTSTVGEHTTTTTSMISDSSDDLGVQQYPTDLSIKTSSSSPAALSPQSYHRSQDHLRHYQRNSFTSSVPAPSSPFRRQASPQRHSRPVTSNPPTNTGVEERPLVETPQHPPVKPCKRPSDFSTEFLLNHHPTPKRLFSPSIITSQTNSSSVVFSTSSTSSAPVFPAQSRYSPAQPETVSPTRPSTENRPERRDKNNDQGDRGRKVSAHSMTIPSPSKFSPACLTVSTWLENHHHSTNRSLLAPTPHDMCRSREDIISTSSSSAENPCSPVEGGERRGYGSDSAHCFSSPVKLGREDGHSAFRGSTSDDIKQTARDDYPSLKRTRYPEAITSSQKKTETSPALSMMASPRSDSNPSPTSGAERHVPSTSPRDSVFASPHEMMMMMGPVPGLHPLPPLPLSGGMPLGGGEVRRGTSTSPAHSERTSSGCGSPADSPTSQDDGHPAPRYQGDLHWVGQPSVSSSSCSSSAISPSSPFLPHHPPHYNSHHTHVQASHQNPFLPMGLRYLSGLPFPAKPGLPDVGALSPLPYPHPHKNLTPDGLASAFRSTRPAASSASMIHPASAAAAAAAAAYYSSLRGTVPFPFSFHQPPTTCSNSTSPGEKISPGGCSTSPPSETGCGGESSPLPANAAPGGVDRMDMLRVIATAKGATFDPLAAFSSSTQALQHHRPPSPRVLIPGQGNGSVISPRLSPGASVDRMVSGLSSDLADLPRGLTRGGAPAGLGVRGGSAGAAGLGLGFKSRGKEVEPVRYQCEACSKSYSTFSGLSKHRQFHCAAQVKKEFSCKYCDKTYVSLGALKMHIRTHTLPCKCNVCGKAFSRPWLLQGHLRTHTGEKPFSCHHCARAFADRSNLRAHLQTHSDVKKYSCRHCSKTFSRMSLLLKHEDGCCASTV